MFSIARFDKERPIWSNSVGFLIKRRRQYLPGWIKRTVDLDAVGLTVLSEPVSRGLVDQFRLGIEQVLLLHRHVFDSFIVTKGIKPR